MSDANPSWVIDVTERTFQAEVIERSKSAPVVLDVWAPWCGPCKTLGPVLESLAKEHQGAFILAKLNADEAPRLCDALRVQGIPAVLGFVDGKIAAEFTGAVPEASVRQFLKGILPSDVDKLVAEAMRAEASSPDEAMRQYEHVLEKEPHRQDAKLGLARLLFARRQIDRAESLVADVPPGSEDAVEGLRARIQFARHAAKAGGVEACRAKATANSKDLTARLDLGVALAADGQYDEALKVLLAIAEDNKKFAGGPVRETMVGIFHIIGSRSPLADDYRSKLARVLY